MGRFTQIKGIYSNVLIQNGCCDKICQLLAAGQWFSPDTPVSSTNKTECHDIAEIFLKMVLNIIKPTKKKHPFWISTFE
jgi:hypothetical protein